MFKLMLIAISLLLCSASYPRDNKKTQNFDINSLNWATSDYRVDREEAQKKPFTALKKLVGGNRRFIEGKSIRPRQDLSVVQQLGKGQSPLLP